MFRDIWEACGLSSEVLMGRSLDGPLGCTASFKARNQPRSRWNHFRWSNRGCEMTAALLKPRVCIWRSWHSSPNFSSLLHKNGPKISWSHSWKFVWLPQCHTSLLQNLPHWTRGFARSENHGHFHRLSFDHGCARNPRTEGYRCRFPHVGLIIPEAMNLPTASKSGWSQPHSLVLFQWQDCPFKKPVQIGL